MTKAKSIDYTFLDASETVDLSAVSLSKSEQDYFIKLAAEGRRSEFLRARWLLQKKYNLNSQRGSEGELILDPRWTGSISHSQGHVAAVVVKKAAVKSIGIDLELVERVSPQIARQILFTDTEHKLAEQQKNFLALAFAAKEALFKCLFPLVRKRFYFNDAEIVAIDGTMRELKMNVLFEPSFRVRTQFFEQKTSSGNAVVAMCWF